MATAAKFAEPATHSYVSDGFQSLNKKVDDMETQYIVDKQTFETRMEDNRMRISRTSSAVINLIRKTNKLKFDTEQSVMKLNDDIYDLAEIYDRDKKEFDEVVEDINDRLDKLDRKVEYLIGFVCIFGAAVVGALLPIATAIIRILEYMG